MKNLFILGSPRKNGNSATMAKSVGNTLLQKQNNSVEYIYLNSLNIQPCQGCGACSKTGDCILEDDMRELSIKTEEADRIFFVSPIYFYSVTAQLKTYIDRCQPQWAKKYLLKKKDNVPLERAGYLLSCAATSGAKLFEGSELIIRCLCDTLHLQYGKPLLIKNAEKENAIQNNTNMIANCITFGNELLKVSDKPKLDIS